MFLVSLRRARVGTTEAGPTLARLENLPLHSQWKTLLSHTGKPNVSVRVLVSSSP